MVLFLVLTSDFKAILIPAYCMGQYGEAVSGTGGCNIAVLSILTAWVRVGFISFAFIGHENYFKAKVRDYSAINLSLSHNYWRCSDTRKFPCESCIYSQVTPCVHTCVEMFTKRSLSLGSTLIYTASRINIWEGGGEGAYLCTMYETIAPLHVVTLTVKRELCQLPI